MPRVIRHVHLSALCLLLLTPASCTKKTDAPTAQKEGDTGKPAGQPAAALLPVGMSDPFARLSGATAKALERGFKAQHAKKYDEAAAAFGEVVAAVPDSTHSRFQLARSLLLSGKPAEAEKELEQVLSRDFLAYAGLVDKAKEWKALRDAPQWAAYQDAEARYKTAYAQGLSKGFVFVARNRPAKEIRNPSDSRLELNQEVYHYDPATGRYRRLTAAKGQVFAAMRSPDGKMLAFLAAERLIKGGSGDVFVDPQGGYVDLTTLETVGPFKMAGAYFEVSLGFSAGDVPVWQTETTPGVDGGSYVIDTAHTGMTKGSLTAQGERTWAQVQQVWNSGKGSPEGVTLAADKKSFTIAGAGAGAEAGAGAVPVTSARELSDSSLDFSPSRRRITYAGTLDACKVLEGDKSKNELFVYDADKKSAQRIDSGISKFETLWLDDNVLVYENGSGDKGTVNLYDLAEHKKTTLAPRHGAGLYGIPTLSCQAAPKAEAAAEDLPEAPPDEQGE